MICQVHQPYYDIAGDTNDFCYDKRRGDLYKTLSLELMKASSWVAQNELRLNYE